MAAEFFSVRPTARQVAGFVWRRGLNGGVRLPTGEHGRNAGEHRLERRRVEWLGEVPEKPSA